MAKKKRESLLDKIYNRLIKSGISERKAKSLAKDLLPAARNGVKAEEEAKAEKASTSKSPAKAKPVKDESKRPTTKGLAKVQTTDISSVRMDLPVLAFTGAKEAQLMQVMDGLTTHRTYIVAAVKGEHGIVAVRKFNDNSFKMKFYPNYRVWGFTGEQLNELGGDSHLRREWYERQMFTRTAMDQVLSRIAAQNKSKVRKLIDRLTSVATANLTAAFSTLHSYSMPSSHRPSMHASM